MKNTDIDSFLRENKPQVKENPTFLLEVQRKMFAVDGIKSEVDRQRKYGRNVLIVTLFAGLLLGIGIAALAYFYPINPESVEENIIADIKAAIDPWKQYILLFIAGCSIIIGVMLSTRKAW